MSFTNLKQFLEVLKKENELLVIDLSFFHGKM